MNQLSSDVRRMVLNMLVEGMGMRATIRTLGVSYNAVSKLLRDAGEACHDWHDKNVREVDAGRVQCDEIWGFVYAKQKQVPYLKGAPDHAGHTWTWTALDSGSKMMLSWLTGPRGYESAFLLMADLASRMRSCQQLTTDGLYSYEPAVEDIFGRGKIPFGQYVKPNTTDSPFDEQVYNRPRPVQRAVFGEPDKTHIGTSFVERSNLTLRMGNRRFTRCTNGHSKTLVNHKHALDLYYTFYNFCRPHMSLKGATPAMAAGLAKQPYGLEWVIDLINERRPKPNRPSCYMTKRRRRVLDQIGWSPDSPLRRGVPLSQLPGYGS